MRQFSVVRRRQPGASSGSSPAARGGGLGLRLRAAALGVVSLCANMACRAFADFERSPAEPGHDGGRDDRPEGSGASPRPDLADAGQLSRRGIDAGRAAADEDAGACADADRCDAGAPPLRDVACIADAGCLPPCDGCRIGDTCVRHGSRHPDNVCLVCDASRDAEDWSANDGMVCDDQLYCTQLAACSAGICRRVLARDCGSNSCTESRGCVCTGDC